MGQSKIINQTPFSVKQDNPDAGWIFQTDI